MPTADEIRAQRQQQLKIAAKILKQGQEAARAESAGKKLEAEAKKLKEELKQMPD